MIERAEAGSQDDYIYIQRNNKFSPESPQNGRARSRQGSIMDQASSGGQMAEQAGRTGREGDRQGRQGRQAGGAKRGKLPASSEAQGNTMQRQASRTKCQRHPKITAEGECHTHLVPKDAPDTCLRCSYPGGHANAAKPKAQPAARTARTENNNSSDSPLYDDMASL